MEDQLSMFHSLESKQTPIGPNQTPVQKNPRVRLFPFLISIPISLPARSSGHTVVNPRRRSHSSFCRKTISQGARLFSMEIVPATVILGVLFALLFFIPTLLKSGKSKNEQSNANRNTAAKGPRSYTKAEVALHNKRTDCWIILKDKVYDVTSYVEEHPGGDAIFRHAGEDSTEGFFGPQHGTGAFQLVEDFCIGTLEK